MRNSFADVFYELAKQDPKLFLVVADISPAGSVQKFRQEFPERFINTGVAEQSMIGIAAGLALRGCRAFAYTIATFALYRPFEFIRDDVCYQGLPVTVVGIGGGVTYSTLGATHHAMEDVAVARAIPGMSVIAPCDPDEARAATTWCATKSSGPTYLRMGKAGEPVLSAKSETCFEFGKLRYLRRGTDVCVVGYGPILATGVAIADEISSQGKSVSVVSCHTLAPLDEGGLRDMLKTHKHVIVLEEHVPTGGLGVELRALAQRYSAGCTIDTFSLRPEFLHCYGSHEDVLSAHGLDKKSLLSRLRPRDEIY